MATTYGTTEDQSVAGAASTETASAPPSYEESVGKAEDTGETVGLLSAVGGPLTVVSMKDSDHLAPDSERLMAPRVYPNAARGACSAACIQHRFNLVFTLLLVAVPAITLVASGMNFKSFAIALCIIYAIYLIESFLSSTCRFLSNVVDIQDMYRDLDEYRTQAPNMWYKIRCWHYETRVNVDVETKKKKGKKRETSVDVSTEKEQVYTHSATGTFVYSKWKDYSPHYPDFTQLPLTMTTIELTTKFVDPETEKTYERQKQEFYAANTRDENQDRSEGVTIDGMKNTVMVESDPSRRPCCLSMSWFVCWSVIGFSWCYRCWMMNHTGTVDYKLAKHVWCEPSSEINVKPIGAPTQAQTSQKPNSTLLGGAPITGMKFSVS